MKVTVYIKNVYGNELVYPIGKTANELIKLTDTKTFTPYHLKVIKQLGYEIQPVLLSEIVNGANEELQTTNSPYIMSTPVHRNA